MQRVLSGIQPSGSQHIGHLVGALDNFEKLQHGNDAFYMIVDWHALTSKYESAAEIWPSTLELTAFEPNAKWASKVIKGPVPFEVTVTFEASGSATKMSTHVEGEPKGFFKIAEGMLAGQLEKSLHEDGERLKKLLEGG